MIKVNDYNVEFEGDRATLLTELTMLIRDMFEEGVLDKRTLDDVVKYSQMSHGDIASEALAKMMLVCAIDAIKDGNTEVENLMREIASDIENKKKKDKKDE